MGPRAKGLSDERVMGKVDHFHLQSMSCTHSTSTVTITPILQMRKLRQYKEKRSRLPEIRRFGRRGGGVTSGVSCSLCPRGGSWQSPNSHTPFRPSLSSRRKNRSRKNTIQVLGPLTACLLRDSEQVASCLSISV